MHLDDERLERLRHGELRAEAERAARDHLVGCSTCRTLVEESEREELEIHACLRVVDHPLPPRAWSDVAARARTGGNSWARRAAVLLLTLGGAGVAYAAPGSPLPGWLRSVVKLVAERRTPAPAPAPAPIPQLAGIGVDPGRSLLISFRSRQPSGRVRVTLGPGARVELRAPAGSARFGSGPDQLVVENAGSTADFELWIPDDAPRIEVRVAGERVFLKEGPRITLDGGGAARSPFSFPLAPRNR